MLKVAKAGRRLIGWMIRLGWRSAVLAIFLIALESDSLDPGLLYNQVTAQARDVLFDYVQWEAQAIGEVASQQIQGSVAKMTDDQRAAYVVNYLEAVRRMQSLQGQVSQIYADPAVSDPKAAAADLVTQQDKAKQVVSEQTPLAEAIIDYQVSTVLFSEGFHWLGQVWPPVAAKFTEMPDYLVISPRNTIHFDLGLTVNPLGADQADALENKIDHALNVSALVVPLGGLSLYPSMVAQTWYAPALFSDVAHEWSHLYMALYPLGWNYDQPETRIINESTAERFGTEIGRETIERYYQHYPAILNELPPVTSPDSGTVSSASATTQLPSYPDDQPPFDYGAELNQIRVTVDFYLWLGRVDLAEAYMDAMRSAFTYHGYSVRKINQAFFAFYGGYQSGSVAGAGGTDPTGDAIMTLRARSPSILAWINQMRWMTTRADLVQAAGAAQADKVR